MRVGPHRQWGGRGGGREGREGEGEGHSKRRALSPGGTHKQCVWGGAEREERGESMRGHDGRRAPSPGGGRQGDGEGRGVRVVEGCVHYIRICNLYSYKCLDICMYEGRRWFLARACRRGRARP